MCFKRTRLHFHESREGRIEIAEERGRREKHEMLEGEMRSSSSSFSVTSPRWIIGVIVVVTAWCIPSAVGEGAGRNLLGIRETQGNVSFHCSPSGPCLRCQYSEKNDEKYRCSETGYRIPLKCIEIQDGLKEGIDNRLQRRLLLLKDGEIFDSRFYQKTNKMMPRVIFSSVRQLKWTRLLDTTLTSEGGKQSYITYRSCLPAQAEEKLSVLGFEVMMVFLLLISGSVTYLRQKHSAAMAGVGSIRIPNNSSRL